MAFSNLEIRRSVWLLTCDLDRGSSSRSPEHVTEGSALHEYASLSGDGRYVAFASNQSGRLNIWLRDLATGSERDLADSSFTQRYPVISASGDRVAISSYEGEKRLSVHSRAWPKPREVM